MALAPSILRALQTPFLVAAVLTLSLPAAAQQGTVPRFVLPPDPMELTRTAQPAMPLDKVGHRFALLGTEAGVFEAWAWPLKLLRELRISFLLGDATRTIPAEELVRRVRYRPDAAVLTYVHASFTMDVIVITPPDLNGALLLLAVDSDDPLTLVFSFLPVLQPMWPAGAGGQYARWDPNLNAYLIGEPTRRLHGIIGSPAAAGISYTPAHMLSDTPNEFTIPIDNPDTFRGRLIPVAIAGGQGERGSVVGTYRALVEHPRNFYEDTRAYHAGQASRRIRIVTPDDSLNLALDWSGVSFDNLLVDHPSLGRGMVAGLAASGSSGRPGFGWFFGGDTYVNTLSLLRLGAHEAARDALRFMHAFQRDDGKMAHEITQSVDFVDWFGAYPYAYIHADTTPLYLAALYDYVRYTGDLSFLHEAWPVALSAYEWCLSVDDNEDGLMDNRRAGLGALEYGDLTAIQTDVYLAAAWLRATEAMSRLADLVGDSALAAEARTAHQRALSAFEEHLWDQEDGQYAYAFDAEGKTVSEITPWPAVALQWGYGVSERRVQNLEVLSTPDLITDWGVRMLARSSKRFEPLNYNYGAVWPFVTGWVTNAHFTNDRPLTALPILRSTARRFFDRALGHIGEVFSGIRYSWPSESVPHQGFSVAGLVLPSVEGLLGLEADLTDRRIRIAPRFPAEWDTVSVERWRVGEAFLDLGYRRADTEIVMTIRQSGGQPLRAELAPLLEPGATVSAVLVDGRSVPFNTRVSGQGVQVLLSLDVVAPRREIRMAVRPGPGLQAPLRRVQPGDANRGLRIVEVESGPGTLGFRVFGPQGAEGSFCLTTPDRVDRVEGATWSGSCLTVVFPESAGDAFSEARFILHLKP